MRFLFLVCFILFSYSNAKINQRFANPINCQACHPEQFRDWKTTWHSKAHEKKNPLFSKVISFIKLKKYKTKAEILTRCAKCHNPKLQISKVDDSYLFAKAFEVETKNTKKVDSALVAKHTQDGISCFICHNIDKLGEKTDLKMGGLDIVHWTKGNLIVGPFEKNNRAGFHETDQREHFVKGNKLCLTCHQGSANYNDLPGYQTGEEIATVENAKRCVDCHMSTSHEGIIAPTVIRKGEMPLVRKIRSHLFAGGRNGKILATTLKMSVKSNAKNIDISIKNLTPHKAPTGFSARSIVIETTFYKGKKVLKKEDTELSAKYVDRRGHETISYIARKLKSDTRLKPRETRVISLAKPAGANKVVVQAWYYLVQPKLQKLLKLDDGIFTKKYHVATTKAKI